MDKLEPEALSVSPRGPGTTLNAGSSLDAEFLSFDRRPDPSVPSFKTRWFRSGLFRRAISAAINREDMIRLVYRGYAHPAAGPISAANKLWFNAKVAPLRFDPQLALSLLKESRFSYGWRRAQGQRRQYGGIVSDYERGFEDTRPDRNDDPGRPSKNRHSRQFCCRWSFSRWSSRIMRTQEYEACLLGLATSRSIRIV